jgi:hypothetical protein
VNWKDNNGETPLIQEREFQRDDPPIAVSSHEQEDITVLEIKP